MQENLKALLLEIELALKKDDLDQALTLYRTLEQNWELIQKNLTLNEAEEALKIIDFIRGILQEKAYSLKKEHEYLKIRQSYSKFL